MIVLYELRAEDPAFLFSPYCWRIRLALAHKRLAFESEPITFLEKEKIAFSGSKLVPVLKDGDTVVTESLDILDYLDRTYPQGPLGLDTEMGRNRVRLINELILRHLTPALFKPTILPIYEAQPAAVKGYFRESREARFGCTLEAVAAAGSAKEAQKALASLEAQLKHSPFLDGQQPGAADFVVGAHLIFAWVYGFQYWTDESAVGIWFNRLVDAYVEAVGPIKRQIHATAAQFSPA